MNPSQDEYTVLDSLLFEPTQSPSLHSHHHSSNTSLILNTYPIYWPASSLESRGISILRLQSSFWPRNFPPADPLPAFSNALEVVLFISLLPKGLQETLHEILNLSEPGLSKLYTFFLGIPLLPPCLFSVVQNLFPKIPVIPPFSYATWTCKTPWILVSSGSNW